MEHQSRHRLGKVEETLRLAEQLDPNQPDLCRQMGQALTRLGESAESIGVLEKADEQEPQQTNKSSGQRNNRVFTRYFKHRRSRYHGRSWDLDLAVRNRPGVDSHSILRSPFKIALDFVAGKP